MSNRARGETRIIINGEERIMRLTLGALAEIEDELNKPIGQIEELVSAGSIKPINTIVYWMLRGGGWRDLDKKDMVDLQLDLGEALEAFKIALTGLGDIADGGDDHVSGEGPEGN